MFTATNFSINDSLVAFHKLWYAAFLFSIIWKAFLKFFFLRLLVIKECIQFYIFLNFTYLLLISFHYREHAFDFNIFQLIEACLLPGTWFVLENFPWIVLWCECSIEVLSVVDLLCCSSLFFLCGFSPLFFLFII